MTKRTAKQDEPKCPPSHVRRLVKLNCPMSEIIRITGYTAEQINKMAAE